MLIPAEEGAPGSKLAITTFIFCLILYYVVIARPFFEGAVVIGGDTGLLWSLHYFVVESLIEYLQYPLWDPTTLGGYPNYMLMINGWYQNLHPFQVPFFLIATVVGRLFQVDSNYLVVFHKTIYLFSVNLVAVMLISRELCRTQFARLLPPLVYTLSAFQFFALRDSLLVEGLPPTLFFVFGLFYHINRRSPRSLFVFLIFLALYIFGFSYAYLLSSAWWVSILTLLVLVTSPGLVRDSWNCLQQIWADRTARWLFVLVTVLIAVAISAVGVSIASTLGQVIRASGEQPVPYDISAGGQWGPPGYGIYSTQLWSQFLVWAPFPDIHQNLLKYDPWDSGLYHRYMGMALMPLLLIAALFGHQHRFVWPLLLTVFISTAFITYTVENPLYAFLVDNIPPLRNTRPMTNLLPRDVTLLIVFVAAIGLDILLRARRGDRDARLWTTTRVILIVLMVAAGEILLASVVPAFVAVRHSLAHISGYLGLSCLIILVLLHRVVPRHQPALVLALLVFTATDLIISASAFSKLPHTWSPKSSPNALNMPTRKLGPLSPGEPQWVGGYRGQLHQLYGGPYQGTRAWLVLATHPLGQFLLQNWDWVGRRMKAYPDFRFFTNGAYIPFDAIRDIDKLQLPSYVIEPPTLLLRTGGKELIRFSDRTVPIEPGQAGNVEDAHAQSHNNVAFRGWAIDEKTKRPAREVLVFIGDTLWGTILPTNDLSDIATRLGRGYLRSGFDGLLDGPPPAERKNIRLFALLSDGTARELQYYAGYPFTRGYGPGPQRLKARPAADGPPTIYLHDEKAILANVPGREEKISWSVIDWTPNHYSVRVSAPADGYLVNLQNYNRYWNARVDGKTETILPANFALQAIKISRGDHTITWSYDPLPLKLGWLLFYAALLGVLASFWRNYSALPTLPPSRQKAVVDANAIQ